MNFSIILKLNNYVIYNVKKNKDTLMEFQKFNLVFFGSFLFYFIVFSYIFYHIFFIKERIFLIFTLIGLISSIYFKKQIFKRIKNKDDFFIYSILLLFLNLFCLETFNDKSIILYINYLLFGFFYVLISNFIEIDLEKTFKESLLLEYFKKFFVLIVGVANLLISIVVLGFFEMIPVFILIHFLLFLIFMKFIYLYKNAK